MILLKKICLLLRNGLRDKNNFHIIEIEIVNWDCIESFDIKSLPKTQNLQIKYI